MASSWTAALGALAFFPRVLRRAMTGEVIAAERMTATFGMVMLEVKAKRDTKLGEVYAMFALHASGRHEYVHLDASEVDELANMLRRLQRTVRENQHP